MSDDATTRPGATPGATPEPTPERKASPALVAWLRRHRVLVIVLLVLTLVRVALPWALRPVLETQITKQLVGHIEIGGVELSLLQGRFGLRDVAIFEEPEPDPASAAPAPPPPVQSEPPASALAPPAAAEAASAPAPAPPAAADTATAAAPGAAPAPTQPVGPKPLIAFGHLVVDLAPFALFSRTVHLEEIVIEKPSVDLARLADGRMNVLRIVPPSAEEAEPEPEPSEPWKVQIDRVGLSLGNVAFSDLAVTEAESLELQIERIDVEGLAIGGEPTPERPARISIVAHHPDGPLRVDVTSPSLAPKPVFEAHLVLENFPLRRARVYVPDFGWSELAGDLDADLVLDFAEQERSVLRGRVALDDVAVRVGGVEGAALGWKSLAVALDELDVLGRRAKVGSVALSGARVVVTPGEDPPLPLLRQRAGVAPPAGASETKDSAAAAPAATAASATAAGETKPPAAEGEKPFAWSVGEVTLDGASVLLRGANVRPLDLAVRAKLATLASEPGTVSPASLEVDAGKGSLRVDGKLRLFATPGFAGSLKIDGLDVPALLAASGQKELGPAGALRAAGLATDLAIEAGLAGTGTPAGDDVVVRGRVALSGVELGDGTKATTGVKVERIVVDAKELRLAALLAPKSGAAAPPAAPVHVALDHLRIEAPQIDAVRTKDGIALPAALAAKEGVPPAPAAPAPPATSAKAGEAPAAQLEIASFAIERGRVTMDDSAVSPRFRGGLTNLKLDAKSLAWPSRRIGKLDLSASVLGPSKLKLTGSGDANGTTLVLDARQIPLGPIDAYAKSAGYTVRQGALTLVSSAWVGPAGFDAKNWVTLHQLDVSEVSNDGRFTEKFGISLPLGLSLLKDLSGDISLTIPVWQDAKGEVGVGVGEVIRGALASALMGALTSPLKLLGSAVSAGEKMVVGAPQPIPFAPGSDALGDDATARVDQIAELLKGQPALRVGLEPVAGGADERRLRELALLEQIESQGWLRTIASLPNRAAMTALREYLKTGEGDLDADAKQLLEERLAPVTLPPDRLRALAEARARHVLDRLREEHEIAEGQASAKEPLLGDASASPEVRLSL